MSTGSGSGRVGRRAAVVLGTVMTVAVLALAACTSAALPEGSVQRTGQWSQSDNPRPSTEGLVAAADVGDGLITSADDLEALAAAIDAAVAAGDDPDADPTTDELRATDLDDVVLVTVGYHRCTEHSSVEVDPGADPVELTVDVTTDEPGTMCAWSPYTLDVWAIDRDVTGDDPVRLDAS